jgi:hypothetical protein
MPAGRNPETSLPPAQPCRIDADELGEPFLRDPGPVSSSLGPLAERATGDGPSRSAYFRCHLLTVVASPPEDRVLFSADTNIEPVRSQSPSE